MNSLNSTNNEATLPNLSGENNMQNDKIAKLEKEIRENALMNEQEKNTILKNLQKMRNEKANILIAGVTGCGKSSTINALFGDQVAKVGVGVDPETMSIDQYHLNNLTIWDSPGLGDGVEKDKAHAKNIQNLLERTDENGNALIDMALLILDGSQKDYGTSYELLNKILIPRLGKNRILVAINQADQAKKGRGWDDETNQPTNGLLSFLDEKVQSTQRRIKESTGVDITPIYYSAGYKEEGEDQKPYNLSKLLYFIIKHTPEKKAAVLIVESNEDEEMWGDRPEDREYQEKISLSFVARVMRGVSDGSKIGAQIGSAFGPVGKTVGKVIGGFIGGIASLFS